MLVKAFNNTNVIPDGVEKIGQQAYYGQNITSINIPTNIKSIHSSAFTNTPIETNNDYWIDDSLFCINDWLVDVQLNTQTSKLTIPENITKIGGHLQRPGLEVLDCLGDIQYISERAFTSSSLTTLTMNSAVNLKYIGKNFLELNI